MTGDNTILNVGQLGEGRDADEGRGDARAVAIAQIENLKPGAMVGEALEKCVRKYGDNPYRACADQHQHM